MKRVDSNSYYALIDEAREDAPNGPHNIAAYHALYDGMIRVGPQDEGQAAPGGIESSNPEDIEWLAYRLLELALELRQVQEGKLTPGEIRRRPRKVTLEPDPRGSNTGHLR